MSSHKMPIYVDNVYSSIVFGSISFESELLVRSIYNDSNFTNVDLSGSKFIECNFNNCTFKNTNVAGTLFVDCKLNNVPLDHSKLSELDMVNAWTAIIYNKEECNKADFTKNTISLKQALSTWNAFQSSFLYCNLMTGTVSPLKPDSEEQYKIKLNLNAILIENEQATWYTIGELENEFKNNREIYCFVIGLTYMVDKLYPGFTVTPKQIQEVIAKHVAMYNLKEIERVNTLDNIEKIMATSKVCFVL